MSVRSASSFGLIKRFIKLPRSLVSPSAPIPLMASFLTVENSDLANLNRCSNAESSALAAIALTSSLWISGVVLFIF